LCVPSINVLCAPVNGRNPGMASVDLGFGTVAASLDADVAYWRVWDQSEWHEPPGGSRLVDPGVFFDETSELTYRSSRGHLDEFLDADAVVFWGDFHHMAVYLAQTADVIARRMGALCPGEAAELAASQQLLRGQPDEVLARTITFGTTLAFNTDRDYAGNYGADLDRFLASVHGAWFRDGYSARIGEIARAPRTDSCLGADAAFLADGPSHDPSSAAGIGVFVGRSSVRPEAVARFGRALSRHLDTPATWMPWGAAPAMWPMQSRKRLRLAWPELESGRRLSTRERVQHVRSVARDGIPEELVPVRGLFDRIAASRLIVTDTYHLAVNAWRIGTPTILLHDWAPSATWNVNSGQGVGRDKRHDLYSQLDALSLLIDVNALPSGPAMRSLVDRLLDQDLRESVHGRARAIAEHARQRVTDSLADLLVPARSRQAS
jgi:hypothetical protein